MCAESEFIDEFVVNLFNHSVLVESLREVDEDKGPCEEEKVEEEKLEQQLEVVSSFEDGAS
jgi:hypothetical protein